MFLGFFAIFSPTVKRALSVEDTTFSPFLTLSNLQLFPGEKFCFSLPSEDINVNRWRIRTRSTLSTDFDMFSISILPMRFSSFDTDLFLGDVTLNHLK